MTMHDDVSPLLTANEAAEYLRLAPRTLERHRVAGTGPRFVKAGKRVLYHLDHLDAWIEARAFSSTSEVERAELHGRLSTGNQRIRP